MPAKDIYDPAYVKDVFDRCSDSYIAFSYVCSMGFTERWRRQCVALLDLPADARQGFDIMAGTGEVWPHLFDAYPGIDTVTAVDISEGMHRRARARMQDLADEKVSFICDDVLQSGLPDNSADFIVSTFGLKTFNRSQHAKLADLVARVLKPGGKFAFIEASDPYGWPLRPLYLFHLKKVLPLVERTLLRGAQDFAMIGQYSTNFGDASDFADQLRARNLDVTFRKHFYGCATSASGSKRR